MVDSLENRTPSAVTAVAPMVLAFPWLIRASEGVIFFIQLLDHTTTASPNCLFRVRLPTHLLMKARFVRKTGQWNGSTNQTSWDSNTVRTTILHILVANQLLKNILKTQHILLRPAGRGG